MRSALTRAIRVFANCLGLSCSAHHGRVDRAASRSVTRRGASVRQAVDAWFEPLEGRRLMSTYYVSPSGSDSNSGTSISLPWKSIAKVNSATFHPGDNILFQGGQTFSGTLNLGSRDAGNASSPVTFGSYNGQATISSGKSTGAYVLDAGGIWFNDLKFVGTPGGTPQAGINFEGYSNGVYYSNLRVNDCDISGYWTAGILIEGCYNNGGINGLQITNNQLHDNVEAGVDSCSSSYTSLTNLYIAYNQVYDNYGAGSGTASSTGNGIELGDVSNTVVEYNAAYSNGARGGDGGVGIWAYSANDVTFQYNESYDNVCLGENDGDGFDFDADVSNSVMQYNYAFDNDGTGAQLDQWHNDSLFTNDVVRFNVFVDNGRKNNYGNLEVWGKVLNSYLYNNTIYTITGQSGTNSAIRVHNSTIPGLYVDNVHFANNIIESSNGANLINIPESEAQGAANLTFTGDVYWTNGSTPTFIDGNTTVHSFSQWQSIGEEKLNGSDAGLFANPDFVSPATAAFVSLSSLPTVSAYELQSNTAILNAGINLNSILQIASPLTGNDAGKTVPGEDQHLSNNSGGVPPSTSPPVFPKPVFAAGSGTITGGSLAGYDIGNPSKGSNSVSGSTDTVSGGGSVLGGVSDSFRYIFTTLTGSGEIIAKVASLSDASGAAVAGLMIRASTAANSTEASIVLNNIDDAVLLDRSSTGASTSIKGANSSGDQWIELTRDGNSVSAYLSPDGANWTLVGTVQVSLGSTVEIGLAVTSQDRSALETAVFEDVAATGS